MATKSVRVRFILYTRDTTGVADEACYQTATQAGASIDEYRAKWPGRTAVMAMEMTSVSHMVVDDDALQRMAERELFDTSVMDDDDDD
jgi:hypothetical protein